METEGTDCSSCLPSRAHALAGCIPARFVTGSTERPTLLPHTWLAAPCSPRTGSLTLSPSPLFLSPRTSILPRITGTKGRRLQADIPDVPLNDTGKKTLQRNKAAPLG